MLVPDLLLDEQGVQAILDQVGDIGAAQRVEVQARVQAQRVTVGDEPRVQPLQPDPGAGLSPTSTAVELISCKKPGSSWRKVLFSQRIA